MITKIKNAVFITDRQETGKKLYIKDERILALTSDDLPFDREIDAEGRYVSPGFIDIHTHGAGGHEFYAGTIEDIFIAADTHARHGTTTVYPTAASISVDDIRLFIRNVRAAMLENAPGRPHIAGAHLEGRYFAQGQRGAQNPKYLSAPHKEDYESLLDGNEDVVKRVCFAPELEGALGLCDYLRERGIVAAFAHTDAIYEEILPAVDRGCRLATHLYSGMSGVTRRNAYRRLGGVETAFLDDRIDVEVIADGKHLPKELLRLVYKIKGADKICLVTDSMKAAGMPEGESDIGGLGCIVRDGVAFLPDLSAFAGSVATADRLVRVMYKEAGVSLCDAVKMITQTPARVMGLRDRGSLAEGYCADLVFFDDAINVERVLIEGKEFYARHEHAGQ